MVYSPDDVRGRIVARALECHQIESSRFVSHFETLEAVRALSPPVVVLDVSKNSASETRFVQELAPLSPGTTTIILCDREERPHLEGLGLDNVRMVVDPIDPEAVLSLVRDGQAAVWSVRNIRRIAAALISRFFRRIVIALIVLGCGFLGGYLYWCLSALPPLDKLSGYASFESSLMYSLDNTLLSEFSVERRTYIPYERIPEHVRLAFVAAEDKRFFVHRGVDILRVPGALVADIRAGGFEQGGSTITQQLARMIFLKPEKTIARKIQEVALSLQIERQYSKEQILEFYLNRAYFGARAYGIEAASMTYFGKPAEQITISEGAALAGMMPAPSRQLLLSDIEKSRKRRDFVLGEMRSSGFISDAQYAEALASPIRGNDYRRTLNAPYFVDYCRSVLEKKYGDRLQTSGLKIFTTLDFRMQQIAEGALKRGIEDIATRADGEVQAALIAVELGTGRIKAMIGGTDYRKSQFNRAVSAKRQPGSVFKPIVYLAALNRGYEPDDLILDSRMASGSDEGRWAARNYDDVYYGAVSLRAALARSLNSATLRLVQKIGIGTVVAEAKRVGIESEVRPFPSSVLGASEATLLEMVYAYVALATGKRWPPVCIDRVIDRDHISLDDTPGRVATVIDETTVAQMRSMLRSVVSEGTASNAAGLGREVFGKTGTSDDFVDAWFVGFDEHLAVGVWVGRDPRKSIGDGETGAQAALPIWIEFMKNYPSGGQHPGLRSPESSPVKTAADLALVRRGDNRKP